MFTSTVCSVSGLEPPLESVPQPVTRATTPVLVTPAEASAAVTRPMAFAFAPLRGC
jgi:hypothetical protein